MSITSFVMKTMLPKLIGQLKGEPCDSVVERDRQNFWEGEKNSMKKKEEGFLLPGDIRRDGSDYRLGRYS